MTPIVGLVVGVNGEGKVLCLKGNRNRLCLEGNGLCLEGKGLCPEGKGLNLRLCVERKGLVIMVMVFIVFL